MENNLYLTLATSDNNNPWITPLYYAHDKEFNFYFYSSRDTRHSKIVDENPKVALTIFDLIATGDGVNAVYATGKVVRVKKRELPLALKVYFSKLYKNNKKEMVRNIKLTKDFLDRSPLRMYKIIPDKIWSCPFQRMER